MIIKHTDLFFEHYEKGTIPKPFIEVLYSQDQRIFSNQDYKKSEKLQEVHSVMFIPQYIIPRVDNNLFKIKKVKQFFKGYAIFLEGFKTIDDYIKFRFKKNAKSILKKVKRLDHSFPIKYQFYYGNISREEYDLLMAVLKKMIISRFKQRDDTSQNLKNWNHYHNTFFKLINEKKASLFVIRNQQEPICVSLNNHTNGNLFSAVSSYDIDYSKFSLGSIEIYKKIEWCLEHNHKIYEFGMGDLEYKREWSNHIYNFEHQIIYPKQSILALLTAYKEFIKISIKEGVYKLAYNPYKKWKLKQKKRMPLEPNHELFPFETSINLEKYKKIDLTDEAYRYLRKIKIDFIYSNIETTDQVEIFEMDKLNKTFIISGKFIKQKVVFNS